MGVGVGSDVEVLADVRLHMYAPGIIKLSSILFE